MSTDVLQELGVSTVEDAVRILLRRQRAQEDYLKEFAAAVGIGFTAMWGQVTDYVSGVIGDAAAAALQGIPWVGGVLAAGARVGIRTVFHSTFQFSFSAYGGYNIS